MKMASLHTFSCCLVRRRAHADCHNIAITLIDLHSRFSKSVNSQSRVFGCPDSGGEVD